MSAITFNAPAPPAAIFVYGTLMRGQSHYRLLEPAGVASVLPASIAGELLDLGDYPALRLSPYITSRVYGQWIELHKPDAVLSNLDDYEGPEFKREIVHVTDDAGRTHPAWTYVLASDQEHFDVIVSGRWRAQGAAV